MSDSRRFGGVCLIAASISFFLAWLLMPMPGTTDVAYILENVAKTTDRVWLSVAIQLVSSALFVPGILAFVTTEELRGSRQGFAAASLAGVGATGLAADAIYHLLAYEMVQPGIPRDAMIPLMTRFQREDLVFVAPQLVALLLGLAGMSLVASRSGVVSRANPMLHAFALGIALAGGALVAALGAGRRGVALAVLAAFSTAVAGLGAALARSAGERTP